MRKTKHYFGRARSGRGLKRSWPRLYGPTIMYFTPSPEYKKIIESNLLPNHEPIDHSVDAFLMSRGIDQLRN